MGCVNCWKDVRFLRHFHAAMMGFWALNFLVAAWYFFPKRPDPTTLAAYYIVLVSIYANFATHWGSWQGARAEEAVRG